MRYNRKMLQFALRNRFRELRRHTPGPASSAVIREDQWVKFHLNNANALGPKPKPQLHPHSKAWIKELSRTLPPFRPRIDTQTEMCILVTREDMEEARCQVNAVDSDNTSFLITAGVVGACCVFLATVPSNRPEMLILAVFFLMLYFAPEATLAAFGVIFFGSRVEIRIVNSCLFALNWPK